MSDAWKGNLKKGTAPSGDFRIRAIGAFLDMVRKAMAVVTGGKSRGGAKAPYEMEADYTKLVGIATCLIGRAAQRGATATRSQLIDALFLADVAHLNRWGRPISYDHYDATAAGPAARTFDAMLSEDRAVLDRTGAIAWTRTKGSRRPDDTFTPSSSATSAYSKPLSLTVSDEEALQDAMDRVIEDGDAPAGTLTKPHAAYQAAWCGTGEETMRPMDFSLFFKRPDEEAAREIAWMSQGRL